MTNQIPVTEGLFTWPAEEPALIASASDGRLHFPPRPGGEAYLLKRRGVKHELLNAKPENVTREAEIVAQAGRLGAVTISTNSIRQRGP